MNDKDFLEWLILRLIHRYGESPDTDFVTKLKAIAYATPPDQYTPNVN